MSDQQGPKKGAGNEGSSTSGNKKRSLSSSAHGSSTAEPDSKPTATSSKRKKRKVLTAYNVYFRDERKRVLDAGHNIAELYDTEVAPYTRAKRPHNEFQLLVQVISKRWKELSAAKQAKYQAQALAYNSAPDDADASKVMAEAHLRGSTSETGNQHETYLGRFPQSATSQLALGSNVTRAAQGSSHPVTNFGSLSSAFSVGNGREGGVNLQDLRQRTLGDTSGSLPNQSSPAQEPNSNDALVRNLIRQYTGVDPQDHMLAQVLNIVKQQTPDSSGGVGASSSTTHSSLPNRPRAPESVEQMRASLSSSAVQPSQQQQLFPSHSPSLPVNGTQQLPVNQTLLRGLIQKLTVATPEEKPILMKAISAFVSQEVQNQNPMQNSGNLTEGSTLQSVAPSHQYQSGIASSSQPQPQQAWASQPNTLVAERQHRPAPANVLETLMRLIQQQRRQHSNQTLVSNDLAPNATDVGVGSAPNMTQINQLLQSLRQPQNAPHGSVDTPAVADHSSQDLSSSQRSGNNQGIVAETENAAAAPGSGPSHQQGTPNAPLDPARVQQILDLLNRKRIAPGSS